MSDFGINTQFRHPGVIKTRGKEALAATTEPQVFQLAKHQLRINFSRTAGNGAGPSTAEAVFCWANAENEQCSTLKVDAG